MKAMDSAVVIVNPDTQVVVEEAMRLLPNDRRAAIQAPPIDDLFPPRSAEGPCRVCGMVSQLSREHIPPKASGNTGNTRSVSLQRWLDTNDDLDVEPDGKVVQGGITGYMLCEPCNNFTGSRWAREYATWARGFARLIVDREESPDDLGLKSDYIYLPRVELRRAYPGRFIRQALTMMLCVSGSPELGQAEPALRDLVLGAEPQPLPDGMSLFMFPCVGPAARFAGGRWGAACFDAAAARWSFILEVAVPPLGFQLILDGDAARWASGVDISHFAEIEPSETQDMSAEAIMLGFTYSAFPCDTRSKGQMLIDAQDTSPETCAPDQGCTWVAKSL